MGAPPAEDSKTDHFLLSSFEAVAGFFERTEATLAALCGPEGEVLDANRAFRLALKTRDGVRGLPLDRFLSLPDGSPPDLGGAVESGDPALLMVRIGPAGKLFRGFLFPVEGALVVFAEPLAETEGDVLNHMSSLTNEISNMTRELRRKNRELEAANAEITRLMRTDPLTGLANRRYFNERFEEAASLAKRQAQPLSLVMADIDHFKSVNDTYGHDGGDRVLKGFADLMRRSCRNEDLVGRFGGEEFVLLLPGTGAPSACRAAERVREALAGADLLGNGRTVTASFGVARYRNGEPLDALIRRADRCLYRAKEGGRNRTVLDEPRGGVP